MLVSNNRGGKGVWLVIGMVVLVVIVRIAFSFEQFLAGEKQQEAIKAAFAPRVAEYIALEQSPDATGTPYLRGKVVTIDVKERAVDYWTHYKLSPAIQARTPEEAGTAALIKWDWKHKGSYINQETGETTGEGYQGMGYVTLVDLQERKVLERRTFEGYDAAGGTYEDGDYRGERPMFDVVEYLEKLPRR